MRARSGASFQGADDGWDHAWFGGWNRPDVGNRGLFIERRRKRIVIERRIERFERPDELWRIERIEPWWIQRLERNDRDATDVHDEVELPQRIVQVHRR